MEQLITNTWPEFKLLITTFNVSIQFVENGDHYFLMARKGDITFEHTVKKNIPRNVHQVDFEDNFKAGGNLHNSLFGLVDILNGQLKTKDIISVSETSTILDLTSNFTTAALNISNFKFGGSIQLLWTGLNAFNARAILQGSDDGTNWNNLGGQKGGIILIDSPDSQVWEMIGISCKFIRLDYTSNSVTLGSGTLFTLFRW